MGSFLSELKRRHIYRVAAAYAVLAWLLLQVVNNLAPAFELPSWITRAVVLMLIIGFPIAVFLAWTRELASADGTGRAATGKLDWMLIGALVAVLALVSYQQLTSRGGTEEASVSAARSAAASPGGAISLAVLPFSNLSSDKEQEFFSDGMTEEITAALAKIPDLRVVARTSAFEFKGKNVNIKTLGEQLAATHLIEGSVRKAGERVRITVQLIKADDGTHIWSENYDRELTDIFAVQEDIARAITASLRMPLGLKPGENLVSSRNIDSESYQQYLRAKALIRTRGFEPLTNAVALLEQVVARYPDYAPAWALLSLDYNQTPRFHPAWIAGSTEELSNVVRATLPKAEAAAQKAIELDPDLADGYISLGVAQHRRNQLVLAEATLSKALALDPNNPDALQAKSNLLAAGGYLKESQAVKERLIALEPFVPPFSGTAGEVMWIMGLPGAQALIEKSDNNLVIRAMVDAAAGRYSDAADSLRHLLVGTVPADLIETAASLLRTAPTKAVPSENLPPLGQLGFVYLYTGAPERALEVHERNVKAGYVFGVFSALLWHSSFALVRKTERFRTYAREAGLVDYWRAKGWSEFCHPTTGDDFECS